MNGRAGLSIDVVAQYARNRSPALPWNWTKSTSVAAANVPLTTVPGSTVWAWGTSLFGSASASSGRVPTVNSRGLLTPRASTTRTSYAPGGTSAAAVTVNLAVSGAPLAFLTTTGFFVFGSIFGGGSGTRTAVRPGRANNSPVASSRSVPATVTSTDWPAWTPGGNTVSSRGWGSSSFGACWAAAGPTHRDGPARTAARTAGKAKVRRMRRPPTKVCGRSTTARSRNGADRSAIGRCYRW